MALQMDLPTVASFVAALVCIVAATLYWLQSRSYPGKHLPPGKMEWPIGGISVLRSGLRGLFDNLEGDGPRKMRMLGMPTVVVWHPDQVRAVLNADPDTIGVKWGTATMSIMGWQSVIGTTGVRHKLIRRVLGPCFSPQAVEGYMPAIQRICERYLASWAEATAAATSATAVPAGDKELPNLDIDKLPKMQKEARLLTFEVICHVAAGLQFDPQQLSSLSDAFDTMVRGMFTIIPLALPGTRFSKALAARKVVVSALDKQIDGISASAAAKPPATDAATAPPAVAAANTNNNSNNSNSFTRSSSSGIGVASGSVMERLMEFRDEKGEPLSREALQDIAVTLLFGGHETTAGSIIRLLMRLRNEPLILERLRAEQRVAMEKHGEAVTSAALRDMPYLDAVIKETWRLDAVVPLVPRATLKDTTIGEYDVPKGWRLMNGIAKTIHYAPSMRDVPEGDPLHPQLFNPDRWLLTAPGEEPSLRPGQLGSPLGMLPPQMLTFGCGVRYCPGANLAWAEIKIFFSVLLRRYGIAAPLKDMDMKVFPSITVTGGFPIQVMPLPAETIAAA